MISDNYWGYAGVAGPVKVYQATIGALWPHSVTPPALSLGDELNFFVPRLPIYLMYPATRLVSWGVE